MKQKHLIEIRLVKFKTDPDDEGNIGIEIRNSRTNEYIIVEATSFPIRFFTSKQLWSSTLGEHLISFPYEVEVKENSSWVNMMEPSL